MYMETDILCTIEPECYYEIVDFYENKNRTSRKTEFWKNFIIINLMKQLRKGKNENQIRNCIILIMVLLGNVPCDINSVIGTPSVHLSKEEHNSFISIMKTEFV